MRGGRQVLSACICTAAYLLFIDFPAVGGAQGGQPVEMSFNLLDSEISLHEPVYVKFSVHNRLKEPLKFDLGFDRKGSFRFSIITPDGTRVRLPQYQRGGISRPGTICLEPDETYIQEILLNELYRISQPGDYSIVIELLTPIRAGGERNWVHPPVQELRLRVVARDENRLAAVCERLAKTATRSDLEAALKAALALRYVKDPVAVPYLARVLGKGASEVKALVITGLARVGTPEAVDVLNSAMEATTDPTTRSRLEGALWEVKTGRRLEVND